MPAQCEEGQGQVAVGAGADRIRGIYTGSPAPLAQEGSRLVDGAEALVGPDLGGDVAQSLRLVLLSIIKLGSRNAHSLVLGGRNRCRLASLQQLEASCGSMSYAECASQLHA